MGGILNIPVWVGTFGIKKIISLKDPATVEELTKFGRNFVKFEAGVEVPEFDASIIHGLKVY